MIAASSNKEFAAHSLAFLSGKMARNSQDSRGKHGKTNGNHLEAVVLREKWLELNAGKTKADWNKNTLKSMKKNYKVTWIMEKQLALRVVKKTEKRMKVADLEAKGSLKVEFLLCVTDNNTISKVQVFDVRSFLIDDLKSFTSPFSNMNPGNSKINARTSNYRKGC